MTSRGSEDAEGITCGLLHHRWEPGDAPEGLSGTGTSLFSIGGACSWFFWASFVLTLPFHPPILTVSGECINGEDPCYLMVENKQRRADKRSSATPTSGGSGLPVAQEASITGYTEVFKNLGRTDGKNAQLSRTRRGNLMRCALGLLVKTRVQLL